jgi:hypothetical protein
MVRPARPFPPALVHWDCERYAIDLPSPHRDHGSFLGRDADQGRVSHGPLRLPSGERLRARLLPEDLLLFFLCCCGVYAFPTCVFRTA